MRHNNNNNNKVLISPRKACSPLGARLNTFWTKCEVWYTLYSCFDPSFQNANCSVTKMQKLKQKSYTPAYVEANVTQICCFVTRSGVINQFRMTNYYLKAMFGKTSDNKLDKNHFLMKNLLASKEIYNKYRDQSRAAKTCCRRRTLGESCKRAEKYEPESEK